MVTDSSCATSGPVRCRCALIGLAVVLGWLIGAGCLSPAINCEQDVECPAGYRCQAGDQVCVRIDVTTDASVADASPLDVRAGDASNTDHRSDAGRSDHETATDACLDGNRPDTERTDTVQSDRAGHDLVPGDHSGVDQVAPDRAGTDVVARDRGQPDQASSDSSGPADANTCSTGYCMIDGTCKIGQRPGEPCQFCDPARDSFAWSLVQDSWTCPGSWWPNVCCGGTCVDASSDRENCSWCGNQCVFGCAASACCGESGQPCCAVSGCDLGLSCLVLADGQSACFSGCGSVGGDCCAGTQCVPGAVCDYSTTGKCDVCGGSGQLCCWNSQCDSSLVCNTLTQPPYRCSTCGGENEPCCSGSCDSGLLCFNSRCEQCGGDGQRCCTASAACTFGTCLWVGNNERRCYAGCGTQGASCCAGNRCEHWTLCDSSITCVQCGARDQRCCQWDYPCGNWLSCSYALDPPRCTCGDQYQYCCDGNTCTGSYVCSGGTCY